MQVATRSVRARFGVQRAIEVTAAVVRARARRLPHSKLAREAETAEAEVVFERERLGLVGRTPYASRRGGRRERRGRRRPRRRAAAIDADERERSEQREQQTQAERRHRDHTDAAHLDVRSDEDAAEDTHELNQCGVRTQAAGAEADGANEQQLRDERHEEAETGAIESAGEHENIVRTGVELLETRSEVSEQRAEATRAERVRRGSHAEGHNEGECESNL